VTKSFKDVQHSAIVKTESSSWIMDVTQYGNFVIFLTHLFSNFSSPKLYSSSMQVD